MYKHTTLLFVGVIAILILFLFPDSSHQNSDDTHMLWGKFQLAYDTQIKRLSSNTIATNKPVYDEYKWIVIKDN